MKKESPETLKRRLVEEQERLAEYANEEIVITASNVDVRAQLRSMFRALPFGEGVVVVGGAGEVGGVLVEEAGRASLMEERPSVLVQRVRAISFHKIVELMEHCMFELEEEEVEAEEEQRRVQESLGEVDLGFTSPRTDRKHVFRDLTILHDGEEKKEKLVEKTLDHKDGENSNRSTTATTTTPSTFSFSTTVESVPSSESVASGNNDSIDSAVHEKAETAHEKHERLERARMTLMHRTASGGTLLPNKGGEEGGDVKKGRAAALAPRARRSTQAAETGQPTTPTTPTSSRILNVTSSAMGGLAAMKAAMEEKAKLYRPPGQKAKVVSSGNSDEPAQSPTSDTSTTTTTTTTTEGASSPKTTEVSSTSADIMATDTPTVENKGDTQATSMPAASDTSSAAAISKGMASATSEESIETSSSTSASVSTSSANLSGVDTSAPRKRDEAVSCVGLQSTDSQSKQSSSIDPKDEPDPTTAAIVSAES